MHNFKIAPQIWSSIRENHECFGLNLFTLFFVVTWFAGAFYLPRLFVYHAQTQESSIVDTFKIMERRLFFGIATPSAVLAVSTGLALWLFYGFAGGWLHMKLLLVIVLIVHHVMCWKYLIDFRQGRNVKSHVYFRWFK